MSLAYNECNRAVLIGDPDPERFALFEQILADEFATDAEQVTTFSELQHRAQEFRRWRLILVADNLPVKEEWSNVLLTQYVRLLDEKWSERLVGILGAGEPPNLIGVERMPVWLSVPPGLSPETAPPLLFKHIVQRLMHIKRVWPSQLRPAGLDESQPDFTRLAKFDELLAQKIEEIDRVRERILHSQQAADHLGAATDANLAKFKE
ncbi:MAG TPA: hypothetical protein VGB07_18640 [Blastocatellia bacterium]